MKVYRTDNTTKEHKDIYIEDLNELLKIEESLVDKTIVDSIPEEKVLIQLGYK